MMTTVYKKAGQMYGTQMIRSIQKWNHPRKQKFVLACVYKRLGYQWDGGINTLCEQSS